ncbi:MAG: hypothetical protein AAF541_19235 [Pseudomonadota bacterium]
MNGKTPKPDRSGNISDDLLAGRDWSPLRGLEAQQSMRVKRRLATGIGAVTLSVTVMIYFTWLA